MIFRSKYGLVLALSMMASALAGSCGSDGSSSAPGEAGGSGGAGAGFSGNGGSSGTASTGAGGKGGSAGSSSGGGNAGTTGDAGSTASGGRGGDPGTGGGVGEGGAPGSGGNAGEGGGPGAGGEGGAGGEPGSAENRAPVITSNPPTVATIEVAPEPDFSTIELTPSDVGSTSTSVFSSLPTATPSIFGLVAPDVRKVNFDTTPDGTPIPNGTTLTDEYASIGVLMENIRVSNSVYQGAASPPNATTSPFQPGFQQRFVFTVPVIAVGVINTSPDQDTFEFYSPDGELIHSTRDQDDQPAPNFNVDRFVGARSNNDKLIGSMVLVNASGQIELDELIFEVSTEQLATVEVRYEVQATDLDGDDLIYTLIAGPDGAAIDPESGVLTWTPNNLQGGEHEFTIRVEDGRGGSDEQTFTLSVQVVTAE